jgi:AbrB family looped-hinge helix DNA binding protein
METYTYATPKGQVLIPVALRRKLGIRAGTKIQIQENDGCIVLRPITRERVHRVRGMFKGSGALEILMAERKRDRESENAKSRPRLR